MKLKEMYVRTWAGDDIEVLHNPDGREFRNFVKESADKLSLKGFVRNLGARRNTERRVRRLRPRHIPEKPRGFQPRAVF